MQFQFYSQLIKLELSNDHLLQMYYVLYYGLPKEEAQQRMENADKLISIREKIKPELKNHLSRFKDSIKSSSVKKIIFEYLYIFLKLEYLVRNTFNDPDFNVCTQKEKQNIKWYHEIIGNRNSSPETIEILTEQKKNLETLPQ